ncbi:alpha-amylase family protein [Streptomyces griseiscabiei]|uniref:DUF3459 domain-containing protein n=1 Tax=Streptomyces griseiscabiei TaxID=2993540 RepID=A0ABU4KZS0_9ACTN|nr:hypothetical protein [Streptomyces griseiscabiei]MBZ3904829.1 hypothetical protein [Streptomyces griseiscabiei]MDX2908580.1 hypothetical protein [Streptomyces griseiscabiei]
MVNSDETKGYPDFDTVRRALRKRRAVLGGSYLVPEFLCDSASNHSNPVDVGDPYTFFSDLFDRILADNRHDGDTPRGICSTDRIYQSFPRTFAALNGRIGTALTQIAFLPFLRDRVGITIFICLPVGRIGHTNRKGERGSPFAVSNPFDIDQSLGDPLLPEVPVVVQYRALIQACELLGIRPGSIVPMATLAVDSPLFASIPKLGFWWRAEPGELVYCAATTQGMSRQPDLSTPNIDSRTANRFVPAPDAKAVTAVENVTGRHHVVQDDSDAGMVTLANAFPDVLAGDATTYTWSDVAAVRYTRGDVPPPAGRRCPTAYDPEQPAWDLMPALLAWRYHELGERVFLIDVGPSVPPELLRRARCLAGAWRPDFAMRLGSLGAGYLSSVDAEHLLRDLRQVATDVAGGADEDMVFISEELWDFDLPDADFDAVCGPLIYCVSAHTHNLPVLTRSLAHHLRVLQGRSGGSPFLAGVGNHDTFPALPWASALLQVVYEFLPDAVPLIFSGTEWGAGVITNKEFGFDTAPDLLRKRTLLGDEILALFNDVPIDWREVGPECRQLDLTGQLLAASRELGDLAGWEYATYFPEPDLAPNCFGYIRHCPEAGSRLVVLANWSPVATVIQWKLPSASLVLVVPFDGLPPFLRTDQMITLPARSIIVTLDSQDDLAGQPAAS